MSNIFNSLLLTTVICIGLTACNNLPEHARYIPKDAVLVVGVNTKEFSKKIAWNAIKGSKLIEKMQEKAKDKNAGNDLEISGIEPLSTSYAYIKRNGKEGVKITALVPLNDAVKFEAYLKKTFPKAIIKEVNKRKESLLSEGLYVGWNDKLLILTNVIDPSYKMDIGQDEDLETSDSAAVADSLAAEIIQASDQADETRLAAEMEQAFSVKEENALIKDSRFKDLENESHDISFWLNYEILMNEYKEGISGMTSGMPLPAKLWEKTAFTAGVDFEKGKIAGQMHYYISDDLKEITKEFSKTNASNEMIESINPEGLNMMLALHLSPKGIRGMLDKLGVLGLANLALMSYSTSADDILDAFTGDMVMSLNHFKMKYTDEKTYDEDSTLTYSNNAKNEYDFLYAMQIGNKEKFDKLFAFATENFEIPAPVNNVCYLRASENDTLVLQKNSKYIVLSNRETAARSFINGGTAAAKKQEPLKKEVAGHPFGMFANIKSMLGAIDLKTGQRAMDSFYMVSGRNLLDHLVFSGGEFKNGSIDYGFELNFSDKEENSLVQMLDFWMKMSEAMNAGKQKDYVLLAN